MKEHQILIDPTDPGCVSIRFCVIEDGQAVQFMLMDTFDKKKRAFLKTTNYGPIYPIAADLGYHAKEPHYEDQSKMAPCEFVEFGCYYDGSGLNAEPFLAILASGNINLLWQELEAYFDRTFPKEDSNGNDEIS